MSDPSPQPKDKLGNTIKPATGTDANKSVKGNQLGNIMSGHLKDEKHAAGGSDPDNAQSRRNLKTAGYSTGGHAEEQPDNAGG